MAVNVKDGRIVDTKAAAPRAKVAAATPCSVAECDGPAVTRGLCGKHYQRATRPGYPGHAEAAAVMLPERPARPVPVASRPAEITARDRETIEAVNLICEMVGGIPPADIEQLMHLTFLLGGKEAFEADTGLKLRDLHAVWRTQMDLSGQAEEPQEDDDD